MFDVTEKFDITLPSALFPFTLADLPDFTYGRYRLRNVHGAIGPREQQACVELWLRNGVITSPKAAWERSRQVCYLMHERDTGRLAGVNTLYRDRLTADGPDYLLHRMFIQPEYRDSRLMITATAATLCYAGTRLKDSGVPGVMDIQENPKLGRPGVTRIRCRLGYRHQGQWQGQELWYFDFDVCRIAERDNVT